MADTQNFDKLNILKRRSLPYDKYFGDMELSDKQRARRKDLALILEDILAIYFDYMTTGLGLGVLNEALAKQELTYSLYDALDGKDYFRDGELDKYIANFVNDTYTATVDNMTNHPNDYDYTSETPYWVSDDRAQFMAENEANTIINSAENIEAIKSGKTHTIWMAFPDDRVRPTHVDVNGAKIPIDSYFDVGGARMLYPKDLTSELSTASSFPEEYVNCRCVAVYV